MTVPTERHTISSKWNFIQSKGTRMVRSPQHTMTELAAEFGVSEQKLCAMMRKYPGAPKANNSVGGNRVRYPLKEMRAWWKGVLAAQFAETQLSQS